jgi:hypothetical protein
LRRRVAAEGGRLQLDAADEGHEISLFDPTREDVVGEGVT